MALSSENSNFSLMNDAPVPNGSCHMNPLIIWCGLNDSMCLSSLLCTRAEHSNSMHLQVNLTDKEGTLQNAETQKKVCHAQLRDLGNLYEASADSARISTLGRKGFIGRAFFETSWGQANHEKQVQSIAFWEGHVRCESELTRVRRYEASLCWTSWQLMRGSKPS